MDCCHTEQKNMQMDHAHHEHEHHNGHGSHSGHGMSHGSASDFLKRFWVVTILLIPLLLSNTAVADFLKIPTLPYAKWIGFASATAIFGFALVFFEHAWHEIKARQYGMMTLVSLAVGAGYLFSIVSTFVPTLHTEFYLEIGTLIWVLLFGHFLEAKSGAAAGNALSEVAKLLPKKAHRIIDGKEMDVEISMLKEGDVVTVKPGEKIPADGIIIKGFANVDESLISGESKPVEKKEGMNVVAGAICLDGSFSIKLSRVGENSTVGQIQKLIAQAGQTKPRSQKIADKASAVLTLIAGITALGTLLIWTFVVGKPFVFGITLAITVLVITCPHALGLAIPTVTTITTSLAVKNGLFIKDLSKIEMIRKVDYVVFDKTGTLTEGKFGVTRVKVLADFDENKILQIAASLEQQSSHIIGQSIVGYARSKNIKFIQVNEFKNVAGQGIQAKIDGQEYFIGNEKLIQKFGHKIPKEASETIAFIANDKKLLGYITLADAIKDSSREAIKGLHTMGIKVAMLTGDNEQVAKNVSEKLGLDTYFANVLPEDKYKHIKNLQEKGNVVLMVGDGVNDAPAITQSDVGVAIGTGTDVAVESGDIVLTDSNPFNVVKLIRLSRKVYVKMIQNLAWALGYNIIAIPTAAGIFSAWGFYLRPEIGALVMSLSTVIVVVNALTLRRIKLNEI